MLPNYYSWKYQKSQKSFYFFSPHTLAYYVIRQGRQTGIFTDRDQVKSFVS
ncbi:MAG: RNase H1/viroplasmin domain-containing protein [Patescibacteria group bacterium]|nr:RNase H1/viroplasmin domain-containing protein [Patescibacteria group bacterium]